MGTELAASCGDLMLPTSLQLRGDGIIAPLSGECVNLTKDASTRCSCEDDGCDADADVVVVERKTRLRRD